MSFRDFVDEAKGIVSAALDALGYPKPENLEWAEPPDKSLGDLSFRVGFQLTKATGKKPAEVAALVAQKAGELSIKRNYVGEISAHQSGFLNFRLNTDSFLKGVLSKSVGPG